MSSDHIRYLPIEGLRPHPHNARTHSRRQIRQIADSIQEFGFTNPVLVDRNGGIIAGHGRVEDAKLLHLQTVPTLLIDHLSDAQKRAYIIADNKLAEKAGWDPEILAHELHVLNDLDIDFDLTITGLEVAEIDILMDIGALDAEDDSADDVPPEDQHDRPVSRTGDIWCLGGHRLLCGDARDLDTFTTVLGGAKTQMVFTDPPYNLRIDGNVCGSGAIRHREFPMASGEMSAEEYRDFLNSTLSHCARHSSDGSLHFICIDWRHVRDLLNVGSEIFDELKNLCVWVKNNGGMGSLYRSRHELIVVFKKGTAAHINNVALGRYGRNRSNVWSYPGANSLHKNRLRDLAMHPTVKPVGLVADAIKDCSNRDGIILDPFTGSGTTLIAAEQTGRKACAIELDPHHVDTAVRRWQRYTSQDAYHADADQSFEEVERLRAATGELGQSPRSMFTTSERPTNG